MAGAAGSASTPLVVEDFDISGMELTTKSPLKMASQAGIFFNLLHCAGGPPGAQRTLVLFGSTRGLWVAVHFAILAWREVDASAITRGALKDAAAHFRSVSIFFVATHVPCPVHVHVLLHNDRLVRGIFVAFDRAMNPIIRDCVELHPQAGCCVPRPLVFPHVVVASLVIETLSYPSPPSGSIRTPPLALSPHPMPSPPSPSPTDWVVDSGASFHTTPTTSSLSDYHPPHPSHPPSIMVGNGSTLSVTSVGVSILSRPFYLNNVLIAPQLTHPLLSVHRLVTTIVLLSSILGAHNPTPSHSCHARSLWQLWPPLLCSPAIHFPTIVSSPMLLLLPQHPPFDIIIMGTLDLMWCPSSQAAQISPIVGASLSTSIMLVSSALTLVFCFPLPRLVLLRPLILFIVIFGLLLSFHTRF
jgi:hypothetical protein